MDDNDKKSPRHKGPGKSGPGAAGPRRDGAAGKSGKPSFGAKKPYSPRGARPAAAEGERPKRDFKSGDRPFSKGPRSEGKPFEKREGPRKPYAPRGDRPMAAEGERKPYEKREGPRKPYAPRGDRPMAAEGERKPYEKREGPRKPYAPRRDRPVAADGERPKRDFKGGDRPFSKGPRPEGKPFEKREGPRKPYAPRGDRPASAEGEKRFDRPKRDFGDRPQRDAGDRPKRDFSDRPKRDFGGDRPQASGGPFKPRPRPAEAEEAGERIAKRLARAGLASRRDAEDLIAAGRVKVNNRALTSPAFNVMPGDIIHLDGMEIPPIERTRLFLFHKPAGVVTTNRDPEGRKTVFDVLPAELPRLMTIGRLDINTEGLLLLTNDGGLSRVLELPATGWLRRYRVRVHGKVEESMLAGLREGIAVDGVFYGAIEATLDREQGTNAWLTIGLREGKNREVKNILGSLGLDVTRLIRISYGPFQLDDLAEGHVLEIKGRVLRDQLGERLVEESGANFDAEIIKPFSNQPVRRERDAEPERPKVTREGDHRPIGEGGLIKNRKRREGSRDEALGKLSTSPERGARPEKSFGERGPRPERSEFSDKPRSEFREKPRGDFGDKPRGGFGDKPRGAFGDKPRGGKKPEREQRPIDPPGQRKANVWMAPGARPIGKGRAEADAAKAAEAKARKASFKPSYGKPAYGKPGGAKPFGKPGGERPDGGRGGERPRNGPKGPRTR
ncbi:pseudouridine synthase [Mesorhizobium sp. M1148]|uniref:pseudouridine synthase n=1 Tax=unclassified Mesorhizobium TaxID=325217 RepID=UPI0003CE1342|nr:MULTISPECIES: pseudouridine synthase [unclassified Mesorhizobium]ESX16846.1 tRNA synthetase RNA-binding protein [Mesorhizobium sp. LSJC255A00]ESX25873.1 tRNA synthetase RNA-binding protein [Mesorhizobium sp. LSHC440B00]ESX33937.1 tRNA synthetase RNA-binding protein [Mesorhizobium sp. LSHC432A00]ESX35076.1 tRNA synthetase RNA-binding protein [Mesorhizobium sp. LSHC440A00]ESX71701.1 tRNA synthetase RNA-binding protein [Mesorhizobium sp. LSHC414A00]